MLKMCISIMLLLATLPVSAATLVKKKQLEPAQSRVQETKAMTEKPVAVEMPAVAEKPVVVERSAVVEKPVVVEKPAAVQKPAVVEKPMVEKPVAKKKKNITTEVPKPNSKVVTAPMVVQPAEPEEVSPAKVIGCGDLTEYRVARIDLQQQTPQRALEQILAGTPFQIKFIDEPTAVINQSYSGSLQKVIEDIAQFTNTEFTKSQCLITFKAKLDTSLVLEAGDSIQEKMEAWVKKYGYRMHWQASDYRAGANLKLNQGLKEDLDTISRIVQQNGFKLNFTAYENNVVRATE